METLITKREWIEIFPEAIGFLEIDLLEKSEQLEKLKVEYCNTLDRQSKEKDQATKDFIETMADVYIGEDIKNIENRIREINRYFPQQEIKGRITDEDIERARNFPFTELIKSNKAGFATCPFHIDKTPSFYIKKNFGHCFSCGKTVDTIQFLIEVEGLSFIQAVKNLQ